MGPETNPEQDESTRWIDAAVELMGRAGRKGTVRVQGSSMLPTIPPGTVLEVDFAPAGFRSGDVLLFRQGSLLVVHRFLARVRSRRAGPCLRTRGDGVATLDPPLAAEDVVGTVVALEREEGWYSLDGAGARAFAVAMALHDHFWAVVHVLARRAGGGRLADSVWACDRMLQRVAGAVLFRVLHRRTDPPV